MDWLALRTELAACLKTAKERDKLTLGKIGAAAGVDKSTLVRWTNVAKYPNNQPDLNRVLRVLAAIGKDQGDFFAAVYKFGAQEKTIESRTDADSDTAIASAMNTLGSPSSHVGGEGDPVSATTLRERANEALASALYLAAEHLLTATDRVGHAPGSYKSVGDAPAKQPPKGAKSR